MSEIYMRDSRRREPIFFGVAFCVADYTYSSSGERSSMQKPALGSIILFIDIMVVIVLIVVINLLEIRFNQFVKLWNKSSTSMNNFTLVFENKVCDYKYEAKDMMYQAKLTYHIESILKKEFTDRAEETNDVASLEKLYNEKPWEVLDVCFAKQQNTSELDTIIGMNAAYRKKKRTIVDKSRLLEKYEATEPKDDKDKEARLVEEQKLTEIIVAEEEFYAEKKQEYIDMIEYQIYENYSQTEENKKTDEDKAIDQVFVTFRSMDG